ncbi:MAG: hypothetical protein NTW50_02365, partial [Candidatus Berkelbacteria bacterium]|nr:hypothetical protein [Candidatus Berkelbacteria bacterium]
FNAYGFFRERNTICYALTLFSLFLLPPYIYNLAGFWQIQYLAYIYSFLGLMLVLIRVFVSQWESKTKLLTYIAYLLAFLISFGQFVTCGDSLTLSLAAFGLSLVAVGLSYLEDQEYLVVPSIVLFYISVASFVSYAVIISIGSLDLYDPLFSVVFWALAGLVLFGLSYLFKNTRSKCFAYGGLVGPMIGALVGLASDITQSVLPVISLCVGGLLCLGQSFRIRFDIGKYISGGIILTSILWFFHTQWITQAQCYTLPIAAYFSLLAYLRHRKNDSLAKDIFIVLGLIFLTLPTFIQSIAFNDPLYGLILGIESLGLVIAGIAASHKITLRFGIVALVIDVLYQSREFIAEIPKWLIIGLVGLAIMIGATYLLHKSNKGRQ